MGDQATIEAANGRGITIGAVIVLLGYAVGVTGWAYSVDSDTKLNDLAIQKVEQQVRQLRLEHKKLITDLRDDYDDSVLLLPEMSVRLETLNERIERMQENWDRIYFDSGELKPPLPQGPLKERADKQ